MDSRRGLDIYHLDRPLLDEYRNIEGFPDDQAVPDYYVAHRMVCCPLSRVVPVLNEWFQSYMILSQIVVISDMKDYLLSRTPRRSKRFRVSNLV